VWTSANGRKLKSSGPITAGAGSGIKKSDAEMIRRNEAKEHARALLDPSVSRRSSGGKMSSGCVMKLKLKDKEDRDIINRKDENGEPINSAG